jgi:hypothetical protein
MGIVNRRNALVGWAAIKLGKRFAKKKAGDAVPPSPKTGAIAAAVATVTGALVFWRRRRGDSGATE